MSKPKKTNLPVQLELDAPLVSHLGGLPVAQTSLVKSEQTAMPDSRAEQSGMTNHLLLRTGIASELELSPALIDMCKFWGQFGDGWKFLILQMHAEISARFSLEGEKLTQSNFKILDCKEKFGRLSVAYESSVDVSDIVDSYETRSEKVCDVCSSTGRLVRLVTGWMGTRCDAHLNFFP